MKKILLLCLSMGVWAGEWEMFSDGKDTYIYSTNTGEIYIRHQMGKQNYEDVFVKMPRGMQPNEVRNPRQSSISQSSQTPQTSQDSSEAQRLKDMQLNALKKSQDMLNAAIE
nr:hypothetical protein [uncultured Helicobacter sp.]